MSGCAGGISSIEAKAPNGEPSLLFQNLIEQFDGNIDTAYNAYLKAYQPKFRSMEQDANGEVTIAALKGSEFFTDAEFYSKQMGEDSGEDTKTEPEKGSVMSRIVEAGKLIIDPELDSEGNQSDVYGITNTVGGAATRFIGRVSNALGKFSLRKNELTDKTGKAYTSVTEAIINREADSKFKNKGPEETIEHEKIAYTKQEFLDFKRAIYAQGKLKGDLIHSLIQYQTAVLNNDEAGANSLINKIMSLEQSSATDKGSYNWVIEKENFNAIMRNAGIVLNKDVPVGLRDKIHSEVSIANELMGIAGKIDTIVEKPNGVLKIVDYKTGNRFNNNILGARIMNYGSQEFNIFDSALGMAKLQTMMYSVLIKANNPDAQFEAPIVMHIPDEIRAQSPRNAHQVEVRDYLAMIEQYYRNEEPAVYAKLIETSPKIFDPNEYGAGKNTSFTQDMIDDKTGMRDIEKLNLYEVELEQLKTKVALRSSEEDNYRTEWTAAEAKKRDMLTMKILQARTTLSLPTGSTKDYEIGTFTKWLGTINDTHNPYIQAYSQVVSQARLKIYEEYGQIEHDFNKRMTAVMEEKLGKKSVLSKAFLPFDKQKVFENLIHEEIEVDPTDGQKRVKRGLVTEKNEEWNKLTNNEKELVTYMRTQMTDIFNHVLVSGPNAVISNTNGKNRTKLDVYNKELGAGFKMTDDFIPKRSITDSEVKWAAKKEGLTGIVKYLKHEKLKRLSMFYEQNVEGNNQNMYGIPVKYLGSGSSYHNPDIHTSNLEIAFKDYMQHMVNKKHYDQVYALGDSVKNFLEIQTDKNGNKINSNAAEFLGYHMQRNLIGRIEDKGDGFWRKKFRIGVDSEGREITFSPAKFMKSMNGFTAATALWLKIPSAAKNAGQAFWAVSKEAMVDSISSTEWGGVKMDMKDLTSNNNTRATKLWMDYQKEAALGRGKSHPVHVFINTFKVFPDSTEVGHRNGNIVEGGTALSTNSLTVLYSYPEEMSTAMLGMNVMMTMKVQSGPYAGKSMWEVYSNSILKDPVTGEAQYNLPADFTRGKLRMGDGTTQELKGLSSFEVTKMHRIIQRVKGGYRTEERSMIESTALGEMFMLFRRWLPATIINSFKSKYYDPSMGYLAKTDTENEYEWRSRLVEGRWRTFGGVIGNMIGKARGIDQKRGYNWEDLSDQQKKNMIDFSITFGTWAVTSALVASMFGAAGDDDSTKKFASEMNMRLIDQWAFISMARAATDPPAAIKKSMDLLAGMGELGMASAAYATGGDKDDVFTKRGDLKGSSQILKNNPITGSYYDAKKNIENSTYWSQ